MTIGMCLDYMDDFVEMSNPQEKTKKAGQKEFDDF